MRNKKYIIAVSGILLILVLITLIYFKNKDSNYTNNKKMFNELLLNSEYYKASGDYLKSEEILKESLKYNKSEGYYYLGMLYAGSMNDKKRAKEAYIMAYKYKNVEAATYIGMIEEENGKLKEAEKWYKKGIVNNSENSLYRLGKFYYEKNETEKARKYLEKAANKKEGRSIYILAKMYYKEKNWEELKRCQKQILEETEIYHVEYYMKKNIEYMLGTEKEKQYFNLTEEANKFVEKKIMKKLKKYF